ncbi:MAG TPA: hypothetical protein PKA77_02795 [Chitinophagaceae bacterium]|nr:hypothetical protein [Chitinophagaceae bacterium]HMU57002.1 hypothetical protein [Chitinophagaceae bacterium]
MGQAFAIELEDAELIKSMENYLLKLTAKYPCKTFYSRSNYTGKTFPGRTELRDCSALDHVVLAIYRFIEFHSRDIKVVRFFYHTCPECAALHQKYEYVEALNIPCLKEMREIIDEYYQKRYGGQMQKELPPAPGPTAR